MRDHQIAVDSCLAPRTSLQVLHDKSDGLRLASPVGKAGRDVDDFIRFASQREAAVRQHGLGCRRPGEIEKGPAGGVLN